MLLLSAKATLLLMLAEEPGYGLDLIARAACFTGEYMRQGAAYPALRVLVTAGLAEPFDAPAGDQRPASAGGRPRRYYRITERGLAMVDAWRPSLRELARCGLHGRSETPPCDSVIVGFLGGPGA